MRAIVLLMLLVSRGVLAQGDADPIEITQRFANSGALQIALARLEQLQPATTAASRWSDWEQLRCSLMFRLNRHQDLVRRVAALPSGAAGAATRYCLLQGGRSAIAMAQGATARDLLARLMWRPDASADEMHQARLLVIESYLADKNPREAYVLMLRFEQDFRPLARDTVTFFVEALLAAGMEKEAVNWFSQLDDTSPLKLLLRLVTNLITPDAVIVQTRAALAKPPGDPAPYWMILRRAAALQNNRLLQAEVLENQLQFAADKSPQQLAAMASELWQSYLAAAQDVANQNQLLFGDDANWADYAARRIATSPVVARAFYAYLVERSTVLVTRQNAQLQLAFSLQSSVLGLSAVRLFDDAARFPFAQLDAQTRYLLGSMALDHDQVHTAARYWQGLDTPASLTPDEWRLRLARTLARAGAAAGAADAVRALATGRKMLPPELMQRALAVVRELHDSGNHGIAGELYRTLLPLAAARERRDILFGLGRIAETDSDYRRAAEHFLEAALLGDARASDAYTINARIAAAANLGRAGLKDDARSQLNWLQKNVSDPEKLEWVRREMQKL